MRALYIGDNRVIHAVQSGVEEVDAIRFLSAEELAEGYEIFGGQSAGGLQTIPANGPRNARTRSC